jgi:hypothetical protein
MLFGECTHLICCGLKMGTKRASASAGVTVAFGQFRLSTEEGETNVEKEVDESTGEEGKVWTEALPEIPPSRPTCTKRHHTTRRRGAARGFEQIDARPAHVQTPQLLLLLLSLWAKLQRLRFEQAPMFFRDARARSLSRPTCLPAALQRRGEVGDVA